MNNRPKNHKTVGIVQTYLHHYRVPFYEALRRRLREEGIEVVLVHGQPSRNEEGRDDSGHLDWAIEIENRSWRLGEVEFLWQPCLRHVSDCDLLIVQQENRILVNYWLLFRKKFMKQKVAFWGHGLNCQADNPKSIRERWKRTFLTLPDWWFAYTDFTKDILIGAGYDSSRITVVQNAVDTMRLRTFRDDINESECEQLRQNIGVGTGRVGIYCGSLYTHKKIDFLIKAAETIRQHIKDFYLIVIGAGPDSHIVEKAEKNNPWIHYVGSRLGREKALFLKLGDVFLMPGAVGLAILDSFSAGLPLFTTDCKLHGPEIAYLEPGRNGFITAVDIDQYAAMVTSVLHNPERLHEMRINCETDFRKYSIENMVENFAMGIQECLA